VASVSLHPTTNENKNNKLANSMVGREDLSSEADSYSADRFPSFSGTQRFIIVMLEQWYSNFFVRVPPDIIYL
jgi:hypothetical protein